MFEMINIKKELVISEDSNNNRKKLAEYTDRIYDIGKSITGYTFEIAYLLAEIDRKELYKELSFKNIATYAENYYGFKKSAVYNLVKVGKQFVRKLDDGSYHTAFYDAETDTDFNMSQCAKMLSLTQYEIKQEIEAGNISFKTSASKIQERVNALNNPIDNENEEENKVDDKVDDKVDKKMSNEEIEEAFFEVVKTDSTIEVHDIAGNSYAVPESILSKYVIKKKGRTKK